MRAFKEINDYIDIKAEYTYGKSRLDFYLDGEGGEYLLEVKSATLVEDGVAKFPDAPTERGRRHLDELIQAKKEGYRVGVIFIIQREDAFQFTPHRRIDLAFGDKLEEAAKAGVEVYAYNCKLDKERIYLNEQVEVRVN